jgi:predicted amidohydrolase
MSETTRVAVAQMAPRLGELAGNIAALEERILSAGAAGAGLLVAPECATSGYVFESKEEGLASAIELGSPELGRLGAATERAGIAVVVGFLERRGSLLHNSAALFRRVNWSAFIARPTCRAWVSTDLWTRERTRSWSTRRRD